MTVENHSIFHPLFEPESIAVIGASSNPLKPGGRVFKNILDGGYRGRLWPVNPKTDQILGQMAYPDIDSLPQAPDLALIAIPAVAVIDAVRALGAKGGKTAIILTAGFGETGAEGKAMEQEILDVAEQYRMAIIGPNCSGFLTPVYAGKFAGIMPQLIPGSVDFISGSGATVDYLMENALHRGIRFSHVINLGNSIQLGVEDMLALLDENHGPDSSKIILLYLEAVNSPKKLLHHSRSLIQKGCTLVGIKSGASDAGARAAASHTGAMASADHTVQALFDKAGIIRVHSKMQLINVTCALAAMPRLPSGNRGCIVTDAGGPGVMLTDELEKQGASVPQLSPVTIERLKQVLPPQCAFENPVDCLPSRSADQVRAIFDILKEHEAGNIDVAFMVTGNSGLSDNRAIYEAVKQAQATCPVPIIPVFSSVSSCAGLLQEWTGQGGTYFSDEVDAGSAVGAIINRPCIHTGEVVVQGYDKDKIAGLLCGQTGTVSSSVTQQILDAAGFALPGQQIVSSRKQLQSACDTIGFPVAMKVDGPLHKSDVGGVRVDIKNTVQAAAAFDELMAIDGARGVMVQKMIDGVEVIMGTVRDPGFGQLVMFGLGGIYTEVLKDVTFCLSTPSTPLSYKEAEQMIRKIRGFAIIQGTRGQQGLCVDTLADYLVRTARLVTDFDQICELDLNPVKGRGTDLYAVDARILTD